MRNLKVGVIVLSIFVFAVCANAASLSYEPAYISQTIPGGSMTTVPVTVSIADADGTYYLWYIDTVDGDLPVEWIATNDNTSFLSSTWSADSTELTISVPAGTAPGTYSGRLRSKAMKSHLYAEPGDGILIEVVVPESSGCAGAPVVEISDVNPNIIWPPNHGMEIVTVSGTVVMPGGCSLSYLSYSIEDEYGTHTGVGTFSVDENGVFAIPLPVEAWRKGQDKDGRHYIVKVSAENEMGSGSSVELEAIVPHDRGRCPQN